MEAAPGTIARPRELLLVCAAGLALAILMTWPLATDPGGLGRTAPNDADGQFSIWNVSWVARTLVADPFDLFDANIYYPHRRTLAYSEANVLTGAIGVPVYWASRNPWLTLNVVLLAGFASAYVGAYLLLRYLTGNPRASAVGAILYAFCPYVFSHLSHIQLLMTGGIPLSMLMLHRVADAPSVGRGVWLGVTLAAQALTCAYYGIFAGLMVGYGALLLAATRRLWLSAAYWKAISAGAVISLLLVFPFFLPFLRVQTESGFARTIEDADRWSATAHGYLVSSANAHRWLLDAVRGFGPWGEVLFPGMLAVGLGSAGLALAARRASRDRETALLYGTLGLLAFWASFGPAAGLYRLLHPLPAFSFLRAPSRLGLVVVLCLAVLATIALRYIIERSGRRGTVVAALAGLAAVAELTIFPLYWPRAPEIPRGYAALAGRPRAPMAEFPFYAERIAFPLHAQYMLFSTSHWMPLVNGYSDVIPADFRAAAPILSSFPSDEAFALLARRRVRYIAVHWDMFAGRDEDVRRRLERYSANLRTLDSDERMTLYEVVRYP